MKHSLSTALAALVGLGLTGTTGFTASGGGPFPVAATIFGGSADQRGLGLAFGTDKTLYLAGISRTTAGGTGEGLLAQFDLPLTNGAIPRWATFWPELSGDDEFYSVAPALDGIYVAGDSYQRTVDNAGSKEIKGIVVKFPLDGATGTGLNGSIWDRQIPAAPGAFPYGGQEQAFAVALNEEGGVTYVYVAGIAQVSFVNQGRSFLTKIRTDGSIVWTTSDAVNMVDGSRSEPSQITILNGHVYLVGTASDTGSFKGYLQKYTTSGVPVWTRHSQAGIYNGVINLGGALYGVGGTGGASVDFLIEQWDESGTAGWSRQYDRDSAEDMLRRGTSAHGRLFAVGYTKGETAGGKDAVLLEIEPTAGDLLSTTLYGGPLDDTGNDVVADGNTLFMVGETRSFGAVSNDVMLVQFTIPMPQMSIHLAAVDVCWTSRSNWLYQVQYMSALTTNEWVNLGSPVVGSGTTNCVTDAVSGEEKRFYRVVETP